MATVRFDTSKSRALGWSNIYTSHAVIEHSVISVLRKMKSGRFGIIV